MSAFRTSAPVPPAQEPGARAKEKLKAFHEEDALGKAMDARLLRRVWPFVKPHSKWLTLSLGTLVLVACVNIVRPLVMADVVRQADRKDGHAMLRDVIVYTVLLIFVQSMIVAQM